MLITNIHEEIEKFLRAWVKEKELSGDTVPDTTLCGKACVICGDFKEKVPPTQQVFSCDERGLFLKRMQRRIYITVEARNCQAINP